MCHKIINNIILLKKSNMKVRLKTETSVQRFKLLAKTNISIVFSAVENLNTHIFLL